MRRDVYMSAVATLLCLALAGPVLAAERSGVTDPAVVWENATWSNDGLWEHDAVWETAATWESTQWEQSQWETAAWSDESVWESASWEKDGTWETAAWESASWETGTWEQTARWENDRPAPDSSPCRAAGLYVPGLVTFDMD